MEHTQDTTSKSENCLTKTKTVLQTVYKLVFSHVGLILLLVAYTFLGGAIFYLIEGRAEAETLRNVTNERTLLVGKIHNVTSLDGHAHGKNVTAYILRELEHYEVFIMDSFKGAVQKNGTMRNWDFWGSLFFCTTVYTTVGYGHIAPKTTGGRVATIIYALIGIPLFLVVMADLGILLTNAIKALRRMIRLTYRTVCRPVFQTMFLWRGRGRRHRRRPRRSRLCCSYHEASPNAMPLTDNVKPKAKAGNAIEGSCHPGASLTDDQTFEDGEHDEEEEEEEGEEGGNTLRLSPLVAISIAFLYILLGAAMYTSWENWTYLEAIYFIFISMSTIGFGDVMPEHPKFFLLTFVYLIIGLALLAMLINVMVEFTKSTVKEASFKVAKVIQAGKNLGQGVLESIEHKKSSSVSSSPAGSPVSSDPKATLKVEAETGRYSQTVRS